ncbi:MAG: hypothetical protein ACRC8A_11390 [Microcoleaceae cyanobacterium]
MQATALEQAYDGKLARCRRLGDELLNPDAVGDLTLNSNNMNDIQLLY